MGTRIAHQEPASINAIQIGLFDLDLLQPQNSDWESMEPSKLALLCNLPNGGFAPGNQKEGIDRWLQANKERNRRAKIAASEAFAAKGTAQRWFQNWKPPESQKKLCEDMEACLDVVERLYPAIANRGMKHSEDMGLLASMGNGNAEGILAKRAPYDASCVHIEIHCVTGPWNFDPVEGTAEFEPGARSGVLHLVYESLPTQKTLEEDICTYPLIKKEENHLFSKKRKVIYQSEGLMGDTIQHGIPAHKPWNTLKISEQKTLS